MNYAVIVAGGTGSRMGADRPKQFLKLKGRTILQRTLAPFLACEDIHQIWVGTHPDWLSFTQNLVQQMNCQKPVYVVAGGGTRTDTMFLTIQQKQQQYPNLDDIVVTHDAVRPFITPTIITNSIIVAKKYKSCSIATPAVDTIARHQQNYIEQILPRQELCHIQTPQTFQEGELLRCFHQLTPQQKSQLTDACGVVMAAGGKVALIPGDRQNIKITTPFDMLVANAILNQEE